MLFPYFLLNGDILHLKIQLFNLLCKAHAILSKRCLGWSFQVSNMHSIPAQRRTHQAAIGSAPDFQTFRNGECCLYSLMQLSRPVVTLQCSGIII